MFPQGSIRPARVRHSGWNQYGLWKNFHWGSDKRPMLSSKAAHVSTPVDSAHPFFGLPRPVVQPGRPARFKLLYASRGARPADFDCRPGWACSLDLSIGSGIRCLLMSGGKPVGGRAFYGSREDGNSTNYVWKRDKTNLICYCLYRI